MKQTEMKTRYLHPSVSVMRINMEAQLLTGSNVDGTAGNDEADTGAYWTYESEELSW